MIIQPPNTNLMINADSLTALKEMPENSVDSVVTDPPYGLSFMGKKWDYDVPSVELWKECFRVMKPGAFLLSFAGTRTYHRMAVNIEDAGFEIRDMISWLYGSGFPKSLNIGKSIDKMAGAKREVIGTKGLHGYKTTRTPLEGMSGLRNDFNKANQLTAPATPEAKEWEGWGTALKPAQEIICMATKPLNSVPYLLEHIKCQLNLNANVVEKISQLNQAELNEDMLNSVLMNVYLKQNTQELSKEVMDILQSKSMENINWNTMLLWKTIWVEVLNIMSISTTEIKNEMTIELRTLNSLLGTLTIQDILKYEIQQNGNQSNVLLVENLLKGVLVKLNAIQIASAIDNAILSEEQESLHPNNEPIVVARKPLS